MKVATNLRKKLKDDLLVIREEKAQVLIGKNGLTESLIKEINNNLERNKLLKIKFQKNFLTDDLNADIQSICTKTKSTFIEKRGRTIIIYKPPS